ncbi:TPA: plasmid stabilization protein [Escherichia coli]|uniref:plasmid stabilization protein n=1 Tax=Escherichia coli TaxID=562 RepID=UPI000682CC65|nr:plasmid stabilization protein [Escherichia coli]EES0916375.1 plasmid stabilization protein [Escherichia coli]EEY4101575.1 plasmid stabilization protein [Escherichia coli]EFI1526045.1 plasmid stabilization protein [Escherichia coli]EFJ8420090.1 plasmid stabilization protein [Escherichia coli]EGI3917908.1 plasmid stabilization protein [Escherichia coli]
MCHKILTDTVATITELKQNPMDILTKGKGNAVAILNHNKLVFYCVPPELFAWFLELAEDAELNSIADERMKTPDFIHIEPDDL